MTTGKPIYMKLAFSVLVIIFGCHFSFGQERKSNKFKPTYSGCEVQYCYSSRILSFSDTTKLLANICSHSVGCTGFRNAGNWSINQEVISIETLKKFNVLTDLNGRFWKVTREDFEILIHETALSDSVKILTEIENGFKETDDYKTFFIDYPVEDRDQAKNLKEKMMSDYIKTEFTWKYKILVKDML